MQQPFEVPFSDVEAEIESYVDSVFASLRSEFLTLPKGEGGQEFLNECLQTANWLTRSLDQRARTIVKVATEIVRRQDAFLIHGVEPLRPLNLKTVAEAIVRRLSENAKTGERFRVEA